MEKYKSNWDETKKNFTSWWKHEDIGRPLLRIVSKKSKLSEKLEAIEKPKDLEDKWLNVERRVKEYRNYCKTHTFMAEAFPSIDLNIGPGSMSIYLGSEPIFADTTIWYSQSVKDWESRGKLIFDENNYWWNKHLRIIKRAKELSNGDFLVGIPDIQENVDILSCLRGPQQLCYDLIDDSYIIQQRVKDIDQIYFEYYDAFYNIVKGEDGSSNYGAFFNCGSGKNAKIQCDFSVFMSPNQFRQIVQPSLIYQCNKLDNVLYHLDGVDATRHLDAILEIDKINAIQWVPGSGKSDCGSEEWYPIYEKILSSKKSLWLYLNQGSMKERVEKVEQIVKTFGTKGFFFCFSDMEEEEASLFIHKWGI